MKLSISGHQLSGKLWSLFGLAHSSLVNKAEEGLSASRIMRCGTWWVGPICVSIGQFCAVCETKYVPIEQRNRYQGSSQIVIPENLAHLSLLIKAKEGLSAGRIMRSGPWRVEIHIPSDYWGEMEEVNELRGELSCFTDGSHNQCSSGGGLHWFPKNGFQH